MWEDEKEEVWLHEMANQGFHLKSLGGLNRYTFEIGEPKDIVYRLDCNTDRKNYRHYVRLFQDAGWEVVSPDWRRNWHNFRKEAINGEAPEIFTGIESKVKNYQRILFIIVAVSIMLFPQTVNFSSFGKNGTFWDILILVRLVPYLLIIFVAAMVGRRITQLRKKL